MTPILNYDFIMKDNLCCPCRSGR